MCKLCETNPVYEFTNKRKLCKRCFIKYFQKKILYIIRKFRMTKKNEIIGYKEKEDFRQVVLRDILKNFEKKLMIKVVKLPSKKKIDKIAIASTIDLEANEIIQILIYGKISDLKRVSPIEKTKTKKNLATKPQPSILIKPLYLFLDKEVLLYAKLKNLKFKKEKAKKTKLANFIDELEIKHPEVKRAVVKSYLKIYD